MKHAIALILALVLSAMCFCAAAEAFTPITVDGSNYLTNIDNCIASIDQTTLDTDETFSFNRVVGQRTEERGYCTAPNGRGVDVVGGGVAQVATTLYLAVKYMDEMEVVEKRTYGSDFCEGYVPDGDDAVVTDFGQNADFRFTNHGDAVVIRLWRDAGSIYCSIANKE